MTTDILTRYQALFLVLIIIPETRSEHCISTYFEAVDDVDVVTYTDMWTRQEQQRNKMRCSSLCVASACECASFTYDEATGTCYMFTKTVSGRGGGPNSGGNKLTECVVPRVIAHSVLTNYTGCNATYECVFGYNATDHNILTCQANETWAPSGFSCAEIPCPDPPALANGIPTVTSLQVGGVATYTCLADYINRGGGGDTLNCLLGGTWSGVIDMICKLIVIRYTFYWTTADVLFAGTDAIVWVRMYGGYGTEQVTMPSSMLFEKGISESNWMNWNDVGPLYRVDIGHNSGGANSGWKLQTVTIAMAGIGSYQFNANAWVDNPPQITVYA